MKNMKIEKSVTFHGEIDDTIIILIKQKSKEFILIHNNITDCKCVFCQPIMQSIVNVWNRTQ